MSDNTSALDRVMGQAEEAATNFVETPATGTNIAVRDTNATAVAAASRPSLNSLMDSSGIQVDQYLQLKFEGFSFTDPAGLSDEDILATINMADVVPIVQIRSTKNGSTEFFKSYDGETTSDGQNLANLTARLKNTPGTVVTGPYQTSEIPFTTTKDIVIPGKGGGTLAAGTKIGTTPPLTGVKFFSAFLKELREKGLMNETVNVRLVHKPTTNTKGNKWGVIDFKFESVVEEDGE